MSTIRNAVLTAALTATVAIAAALDNAQPRSIHATTSETMPTGHQAPSAVATPSPTASAIAQAAGAPGGSARADSAYPGGAPPMNVEAYAELFVELGRGRPWRRRAARYSGGRECHLCGG